MSDPDLDRRVAEIVGIEIREDYFTTDLMGYFRPSLNIETSFAALEAMRAKGWEWEVSAGKDGEVFACILHGAPDSGGPWSCARADALPLAICRAIVATAPELCACGAPEADCKRNREQNGVHLRSGMGD